MLARVESGALVATEADEDVHGALEAALVMTRTRPAARRTQPGQIATLVRLHTCSTHAATIAHRSGAAGRRDRAQSERPPG
ncbi:MAG: hypothetical protein R2717_09725 [Schumannella sp.]